MLDHFINLTREDCRIILSILSLVARIIFKVVCFYQAKKYHGKHISKEQIKIDYKTIYNTIDFIISIAKLFL